jgi:hypothetical protein
VLRSVGVLKSGAASWPSDAPICGIAYGIVGAGAARMFGNGSRWLACLPPILVRGLSYLYYSDSKGDFFLDLHLFYWGPCVILAVESANFVAILGQVFVGVYGRQRLSHQLAK